ncbi:MULTISPECIES: amino acid ABC transporter permease [unclassified Gilliamella]|uniref:amino acid ABC transporter permease n=1 Tax=unclassified Gilliamella TaxID=2685620 RepID=UPI0008105151|nr:MULTISPECIES: amino acid ABC transporter permease [Gilliamella]MCX8582202.1 amino acid ABC transporter permease [Gilliamella sp. B3482]MCX8584277.1 amino acid ABC transporter permease [Gilliamella sp. B3372]MCX8595349.1 amino acid ABC transporter permease [Gilliamella sp. B3367]MCX8661310.1 amino acid ABC transporter permease [Gilliamella sp. B2772]MCX8663244.1 amino acid ABC transporter permease [Gilliamella sp. B2911]
MNFNINYFFSVFPQILPYLPVTLFIAIISFVFATILGLAIALIRNNKIIVIDSFLALFISLFRGIPSVVLLFIIYYGLPQIFPIMKQVGATTAAIICFSLKYSAYLAEIFRAGLTSVDLGQKEAGLTSGLSTIQVYRGIILPQAMINALPNAGNMFISLLKDSSVAFFVGVQELLAAGKMLTANSFLYFETYLAVGIVYWLTVVAYSWLQKQLERKLTKPYHR